MVDRQRDIWWSAGWPARRYSLPVSSPQQGWKFVFTGTGRPYKVATVRLVAIFNVLDGCSLSGTILRLRGHSRSDGLCSLIWLPAAQARSGVGRCRCYGRLAQKTLSDELKPPCWPDPSEADDELLMR